MKKLIEISIKRPISTVMFYLLIVLVGLISFWRLPVNFLPDLGYPKLTIITEYAEATPQEVAKIVTSPIEEAVGTLPNVKNLNSISRDGVSIITLDYSWGTDMGYASLSLREKLDNISYNLPRKTGRCNILHIDPSEDPILEIAITSDKYDQLTIQNVVDNIIKNRLQQVKGVAQAEVIGKVEEEVKIELNEAIINSLGLDINEVSKIVQNSSYNFSGGKIGDSHNLYTVKIEAEYKSIDDIKNTLVKTLKNGRHIYIKDIAQVERKNKQIKDVTFYNDKIAIGVIVRKESEGNTVEVSKRVKEKLEELSTEYSDLNMVIVSDQSEFIEDSINSVLEAIIYGGILAFIVLFMFLGSFKAPLNISLSIPISIMITFIFMYFFKISLNIISLSGIALGIGMLVDNSIIVSENIFRQGKSGKLSSLQGTNEVSLSIVASTLTTLAVFIPLLFVKGLASSLFREQALTVSFSLISSLLISITFLPMLSAFNSGRTKVIKKNKFQQKFDNLRIGYTRVLTKSLNNKAKVIVVFILLFMASIFVMTRIPKSFFPELSQNQFSALITTPTGASLETTEDVTFALNKRLKLLKGYESSFITVGKSQADKISYYLPATSKDNIAEIKVTLAEGFTFKNALQELASYDMSFNADIVYKKGQDYLISLFEGQTSKLRLVISGVDNKLMTDKSIEIKEIISTNKQFYNIHSSFDNQKPMIALKINKFNLTKYGITIEQLASYLEKNLGGETVSTLTKNNNDYDITIYANNDIDVNELKEKRMMNDKTGVPLKELIDIEYLKYNAEIKRSNQVENYIIEFDYSGNISEVNSYINSIIENNTEEVNITLEGVNRKINNSIKSLIWALTAAILLIYMILASQFESFKLPLIIMFVAPMGLIGVALALIITGTDLNIISTMGVLILSGIIVNDAILLVDFANRYLKEGLTPREAVIKAGATRFRPIIMTTMTTVFGLLPLAIGNGNGADLQSSMAIPVVGGMIIATMLTLIIIPILFTIFVKENSTTI